MHDELGHLMTLQALASYKLHRNTMKTYGATASHPTITVTQVDFQYRKLRIIDFQQHIIL